MSEDTLRRSGYRLQIIKAIQDVTSSLFQWRFALRLATHEISSRYRRTVIGPFWNTLSMAIFVFSLGSVFSYVWNMDVSTFIPYVTTGYIAWMPMAAMLGESSGILVGCGSIITQTPKPYTLFILTALIRHLLIFFHHLVVFALVAIFFKVEINVNLLLIIPGLFLLIINGIWASLLISIACARYRDIRPLVDSALMIALWLTPVFWPAESIRGRSGSFLLDYNIFYHFVNLIRAPLLGQVPEMINYLVVGAVSIIGPVIAILIFSRYRRWIIYWL